MIARLKASGLLWPSVAMLTALAVLLALGTWQMRRKVWKEEIIARVAERARAMPVPLSRIAAGEFADLEFTRVELNGTFDHAGEFHVWAPQPRGRAWSIVTPLTLSEPIGGDRRFPLRTVLVIRGIVPEAGKPAATRRGGQVEGPVTVVGRLRFGGVGRFDGKPDMVANQWFAYDLPAMRKAIAARFIAGSASATPQDALGLVAPYFVEAEAASPGQDAPIPRLGALALANRHLEYALTWYALAATLIGVYFAFVRTRLRNNKHGSEI